MEQWFNGCYSIASTEDDSLVAAGGYYPTDTNWLAMWGKLGELQWRIEPEGIGGRVIVTRPEVGEMVIVSAVDGMRGYSTAGESLGALGEGASWGLLGATKEGFAAIRTVQKGDNWEKWPTLFSVSNGNAAKASEFLADLEEWDSLAYDFMGNFYVASELTIKKLDGSGNVLWVSSRPNGAPNWPNWPSELVDVDDSGNRMVIAGEKNNRIYIQSFNLEGC